MPANPEKLSPQQTGSDREPTIDPLEQVQFLLGTKVESLKASLEEKREKGEDTSELEALLRQHKDELQLVNNQPEEVNRLATEVTAIVTLLQNGQKVHVSDTEELIKYYATTMPTVVETVLQNQGMTFEEFTRKLRESAIS